MVVSDIDDSRGEAVARSIRESGGEAVFVRADVSTIEEVQRFVEDVEEA